MTRTYDLKRSVVTFGRSRACTVTLDDPALSRSHCQIETEGEAAFIRDLNSRNGTLMAGERVRRQRLHEGDPFRIGNCVITFLGQMESAGLTTAAPQTASFTARLFDREAGNARARDDRRDEEFRRMERLLELNRRIAAEIEPERVLVAILDAALEFVDAERGFLMTVEGDRLYIPVARDFWRKDIPAPAFEISRNIALETIRRGKCLVTDDASEDVRFDEKASVVNLKIRSVLCVPLKDKERVIGAIYLDNRFTRGSFGEKDIRAIEAFADQAAISLINSGLIEKEREVSRHWREKAKKSVIELETLKVQMAQLEREEGLVGDHAEVVGRSEPMLAVLRLADRVASSDLAVLIRGESGTGKELIARSLHRNGARVAGPFVAVDCGAFAPSVLEAELFGHAAGAFTGARGERPGLLESAHGGTLFLDEVGELDPEAQKSLLRVLETGEFRRLGETRLRQADFRLISATHRDLEAMIEAGPFRRDLYYRLKGVEIELPPLRQRLEDLPALVRHFLRGKGRQLRFSAAAKAALYACSWPGNLRQLRNEIERLSVVAGDEVRLEDLSPELREGGTSTPIGNLKEQVDALERRLIEEALQRTEGNKTRAAEILGLSRLGLRKKMARLGLDDGD
ncbi:MAG: sigma 54-interacting transcriptional regulator [Planctomycetes bacterium]|nr:sigma 54-interacting transcriptional regulator [Planctomycetota bacterium]